MSGKLSASILFFVILGSVAAFLFAFKVNEGEQVIITQFGQPIGDPITDAGIHFRIPVMHEVRRLEKRILNWDGYPNQVPTRDKKFIKVDTTARWKIKDPLKFIQTVQNERGARTRLDAILDGVTRDIISGNNLVEVVRNSNNIMERLKEVPDAGSEADSFNQIEQIEVGREQLSKLIIEKAKSELSPLGIELIDVQLKRISYEESVEKKVYERMISERQRIAEKIRSIGKGERAKVEGKISQELQKIQSESYRKAKEIRGEADATAIRIYASALKKDPAFYNFMRKLNAYEKSIKPDTKMILATDAPFFNLLDRQK